LLTKLLKIRYGQILVKSCKSYKHADQETRESLLQIEALWSKIQRQLQLLRDIWPSLDEDYQIHQNSILQVLHDKVQAATSLVDRILQNPQASTQSPWLAKIDSRRLKYAAWVKESLKSVVDDLKAWGEIFDISWYLIIRLSSKEIDRQLQPVLDNNDEPLSTLKGLRQAIKSSLRSESKEEDQTIFLPWPFHFQERTTLFPSNAEVWLGDDGRTQYLVDPPSSISTLSDSCKLAKILRRVEPETFGILLCHGLLKSPSSNGSPTTRFVFLLPSSFKSPRILRSTLLLGTHNQPLDDSFEVAKQLAKSVMFIHSAGFVHKNIRPETILILRTAISDTPFAFLTGFESFRIVDSKTQYNGDECWERNLYRHPMRQGVRPEEEYVMQHDIYSLGVCLLEIGLGTSLVLFSEENLEALPSPYIAEAINDSIKDRRKKAFEVKRRLVTLAQNHIPQRMGRRYTEVVVTCLTCLDKTDNAFGEESEFLDENGILVGVRYIEKVGKLPSHSTLLPDS